MAQPTGFSGTLHVVAVDAETARKLAAKLSLSEEYYFEPVDTFTGDTFDTVKYRTCDFCHEAGYHDLWDGREFRQFYTIHPDELTVCENCLDKVHDA